MSLRTTVRDAFPPLADIGDEELRTGVVDAWEIALRENGTPDLDSVRWFGPYQAKLGLSDEYLVDHIGDVAAAAGALAEAFINRRDAPIDLDVVTAGALVHDLSHVAEFDGPDWSPVGELLGHPFYGVHVARRAGLPLGVQHIVISHPPTTATDPATLEAEIVARADAATASAIKARAYDNLLDAPAAGRYG